ncbi:MAG: sigma-70 family RNA polymerase sigma factor [Bryobacteraceae bacterium]
MTPSEPVTALLRQWRSGREEARDELVALVYPQLRALAQRYMGRESEGHTLSATALVHEAYMKIMGTGGDWEDRAHFFAVSARVMRHILIDHAKTKHRAKRGGGAAKLSLDDVAVVSDAPEDQLLDLHEALDNLAAMDPRKAQLVELAYFGGLNLVEAGTVLGISQATVQREMRLAKAWLYNALRKEA